MIISISSLIICLAYIITSIKFKHYTDDYYFAHAIDNGYIFDILRGRYNEWSGRVLIEAILIKTINNTRIAILLMSASCILIACSISKLASNNNKSIITYTSAALLLLMCDFETNLQAMTWITGAYNYMLPVSLGLYAISINISENKSTPYKILSCVFIFISCNNEQFAATAFIGIFSSVLLKSINKSLSIYDVIFLSFIIIGGAIVICAPGNIIRLNEEIVNWMPGFSSYNLFTKLSIGIDRISSHINSNGSYIFLVCCIAALASLLINGLDCLAKTIIALVLLVKISSISFHLYNETSITNLLMFSKYITPAEWANVSIYASYMLNLLSISSILLIVNMLSESKSEAIKISTVVVCSVLSAVMIGFSPTAYASGSRVMFIFNVGFVISSLFIMQKILCKKIN